MKDSSFINKKLFGGSSAVIKTLNIKTACFINAGTVTVRSQLLSDFATNRDSPKYLPYKGYLIYKTNAFRKKMKT